MDAGPNTRACLLHQSTLLQVSSLLVRVWLQTPFDGTDKKFPLDKMKQLRLAYMASKR